jgi:mono/diheme cytochrome c family protein
MVRPFNPVRSTAFRHACILAAWVAAAMPCARSAAAGEGGAGESAEAALEAGEAVYRLRCASCHGASGEGVEGKHPQPLAGERSVAHLARFIEKSMPEDAPGTLAGEDAEKVARYIHEAFYSPIAQARRRPPSIDPARLTVRQHRNAVADLISSFRGPAPRSGERGLRAAYFDSHRPGRNGALERVDPELSFKFDPSRPPAEQLGARGFAARWEGSVTAPETGTYEFIVRTDHAARLWLNDPDEPLIDAWVKSGGETEYRASRFLIDGRAYPLKLEFTSRKQGVQDNKKKEENDKPVEAFIELRWRMPGRVPQVIPSRLLSPEPAPEVFVLEAPFPPDDRSAGYERGIAVSEAWDGATTEAAIETAGYVVEHIAELTGARKADADRETKLRAFGRRFVEGAFRRPLDDEQVRLYVDRRFAQAPDLETAVKRVVLLALKSPRFLFLELGGGSPDGHAVASRLSFALWDSIPDQELLGAAAAGELAAREQVSRQARRMIDDPRAAAKLRQFLRQWLGVEAVPDIDKDPKRFPGFDAAWASDLRESLELFLEDALRSDGRGLADLLGSSELYLNGRLARYYGYDLPPEAPFQKVSAKHAERAGVLSHPYIMARFAYSDVSSPIHRGVFLVRSMLGRSLRQPPEAFSPLAPDLHPDLTTRERVALQTEPQACQSCHAVINRLGFAMERFDAAGRYRDAENGRKIDSSGAYDLPSGETRSFSGARELADFLAASEETRRAFVSQLFHHAVKQPLPAYGAGTPARLLESFAAAGENIPALMAEIATAAALAATGPEGLTAAPDATAAAPRRPPRRSARF